MSFTADIRHRLVPDAPAELEWLYLVGETFAGERAIVPLLEELQAEGVVSEAFRAVLQRQIDEEADHVERYRRLLGDGGTTAAGIGTGYHEEFATLVRGLKSPALRLFALQAMLEGLSLGAIAYRLENFSARVGAADDRQIYLDEQGHTRFGYAFLKPLIAGEGALPLSAFQRVAKDVNRIFATAFRGETIAAYFRQHFGLDVGAESIELSSGIGVFRRSSARVIVGTKNEFLTRYAAAVTGGR